MQRSHARCALTRSPRRGAWELQRRGWSPSSHTSLDVSLVICKCRFMPQIFVNIAVNDLDASKEFYTAIGFTLNPAFSDHNVACFVIDADHNYVMVHTREFYQT